MAPRNRILAFGAAAVLVLAGVLCAVLVSGLTGEVLTTLLLSLGLAGAVLLAFFEIGLSEDRDLAREREGRERASVSKQREPGRATPPLRRPVRLPRRPL